MRNQLLIIAGFIFLVAPFISHAQKKSEADAIIGYWYTENNKSLVKIYRAVNGKYYGKITWLKEPYEEDGSPKVDDENPDPAKRNQPIIGLLILKGFTYDGDNEWSGGTIYDPENGKTYKCYMKLTTPEILDVRGYIGVSLIGRTTRWIRKTN